MKNATCIDVNIIIVKTGTVVKRQSKLLSKKMVPAHAKTENGDAAGTDIPAKPRGKTRFLRPAPQPGAFSLNQEVEFFSGKKACPLDMRRKVWYNNYR
ncbi:hypothetical protein KH017_01290 [bacterium]|nr:hypothetical protein [bacterium]